jgi:hypothetical protein
VAYLDGVETDLRTNSPCVPAPSSASTHSATRWRSKTVAYLDGVETDLRTNSPCPIHHLLIDFHDEGRREVRCQKDRRESMDETDEVEER